MILSQLRMGARQAKNASLFVVNLAISMIMIIIPTIITVINDHPQAMRTPRNIFVINLAISDLLLCSFTIPFTLADSLIPFWELGPEMVMMIMVLMTMVLMIIVLTIMVLMIMVLMIMVLMIIVLMIV